MGDRASVDGVTGDLSELSIKDNTQGSRLRAEAAEFYPSSYKNDDANGKTVHIEEDSAPPNDRENFDENGEEVSDEPPPIENSKMRKENVSIVFIGHIDAGKSTLVDKRTIAKYEKEAKDSGKETWYLSWILDLFQEERSKGKTTEYGRGFFETEKRRFTLLDAPGHKSYVPSMIEGASQADVAILVVSARKGEFETGFERGGQTREHLILAKTVGVKKLILVLNKMDDTTVEWSEERYNTCISKIMPFVRRIGFDTKDIICLPLSAYVGTNVLEPVSSSICPWYNGESFFQVLDNLYIADRGYNSPLVLPITDRYRDGGLFVAGKIESGTIKKNQTVVVYPNKIEVEIISIIVEGDSYDIAYSGETVKVRLKTTDEENISPGHVISVPDANLTCTNTFVAQIAIIEYKSIICETFSSVIHINTATSEAVITKIIYIIDKKTKKKIKPVPKYLKKGDHGIVVIELPYQMCLSTFNEITQLGRFTLRDEGTTIAAGKIIQLPKQ